MKWAVHVKEHQGTLQSDPRPKVELRTVSLQDVLKLCVLPCSSLDSMMKHDHLHHATSRIADIDTESASNNKCHATRNKCLTSSNKKLLGTGATLVVTSALLVVTRSY